VIHLAAETHVDRSIIGPAQFVKTNIIGTFNLLELSRKAFARDKSFKFYNVSTDEVYGSIDTDKKFTENSPQRPNSPYAASKAAADQLVRSYNRTYGLDVVTSNCCNNYGAYQFPEKLVPLVINNVLNKKPIPVYGDGQQVRDWLFVIDHCAALDVIFHEGVAGETYNISTGREITNLELIRKICTILDRQVGTRSSESLIEFVKDRPGHDRRYAMDSSKLRKELDWRPQTGLDIGLEKTIDWYINNKNWLNKCISGEYLKYYETQYVNR
jgi:dTDP-glucose 4,6-dehydratase